MTPSFVESKEGVRYWFTKGTPRLCRGKKRANDTAPPNDPFGR